MSEPIKIETNPVRVLREEWRCLVELPGGKLVWVNYDPAQGMVLANSSEPVTDEVMQAVGDAASKAYATHIMHTVEGVFKAGAAKTPGKP